MIEWNHRYGNLDFDRGAIVRAALRAYVEAIFGSGALKRVSFAACAYAGWTGDLERGAFRDDDGCGNYNVVAWTEAGIVGLAYELGWGPIEQLDLSPSAVTGGPDDVRGAVPGLPEALEPALVMATGMLGVGPEHGQRDAGVGFWLHGDRAGGTFFDDPTSPGAKGLAMWGLLRGGRLLPPIYLSTHPSNSAALAECDRKDAPIHALLDAVVDRRLKGPTEFTPAELEALRVPASDPTRHLGAQRLLQKVGITWPGSPEIPDLPRQRRRNPFFPNPPTTTVRPRRGVDQGTLVRAALRAYVENVLARLDPLDRHPFAASFVPRWTGDLEQGAFRNGDAGGGYEVIAWSDAGVVGLAYELGYGPIEHLELPIDAVKGGPDDVRVALPELPAELASTLEMATCLLDVGAHGEKLASVGFWLRGAEVGGSFHDTYIMKGAERLRAWHSLQGGRLRRWYQGSYVADLGRTKAAPIQALVDAVTTRALAGPTELSPDELATLLPTPPDPARLLEARRLLQQVGVTWPG
ncbi:hypothetical protein [Polyangium spumosum]|uniref:Uncharacterized protein n=1 Tax=Polyangium spumosum TaxID=889282 RepID=A0A6N7Q0M1_9BACT|nr:hypothetical protein [Polyangium spumosum]MRG96075.1 hypothetical protein [Polyangium spumosum]